MNRSASRVINLIALLLCCVAASAQTCNTWLELPSAPAYAESAEIDIPGNTITIEATFNRTQPYSGGLIWAGDLVSKHSDPNDVNYLLRPNNAEITTTNGYFRTPDICEIELNKTYHVALVYDGQTLKFFRNGFLMSSVPATGTLYQNDWLTRIGYYEPGAHPTNFIGFIDEVRIWNVVRTQDQIRTYMNTSLPSPATQTGLLAYYTFENLNNKQGNAAYDLSLSSAAEINKTNTSCTLVTDSCDIINTPPDSVLVSNDTTICINTPVQLETLQGFVCQWTPSDFLDDPSSASPISNPLRDITYYVTATHVASNTVMKDTITLRVSHPELSVSNDTAVCGSTPVPLQAQSPYPVLWSPTAGLSANNINNPIAVPAQSTDYVASTTDSYGCTAQDTVTVTVNPNSLFSISGNSKVCAGEQATISATGGHVYNWSSAETINDLTSPVIRTSPLNHASYTVQAQDTVCQRDTLMQWNVVVETIPDITVSKSNDITCEMPFAILEAQGAETFLWTPSRIADDPTGVRTRVAVDSTTTFIVEGTASNGCRSTETVTVYVEKTGSARFDLPNAFTPNGDGKNDCFGIRHWGDAEVQQFMIYNRWGQVVFQSADPTACWDGKYKGIRQPSGGYVFIIKARTFCGDVIRRGMLTLVQ